MDDQGNISQIDHSALRTNQAFVIGLLLLAFILDSIILVVFVCLVMVLGTAIPRLSLFIQIYRWILKPAGLVKADVMVEILSPIDLPKASGRWC